MKFSIASAPDKRLSEEDYLKFKEEYLHSEISWNDLKNKYGLSKKEHSETCKRVKQEEGLSVRPSQTARYFYKSNNSYQVIKRINGTNIVFGTFPTSKFDETDLKTVIKKCKEFDWNVDKCKLFIKMFKLEKEEEL